MMPARKSSPIESESLTPAEVLQRHCESALQSEALTLAVRNAEQAQQRRKHIEVAIGRNREQSAAAEQRIAEVTAALPNLDAQFALASANAAMDPALEDEVARLQSEVDAAVRERADRQLDIERSARTVAVLEREIAGADKEIAAARTQVDIALTELRTDLMPAIDEAVAAAAAPLAAVKSVLLGLVSALPGIALRDDAEALRIVAPSQAFTERIGAEVWARGDDLLETTAVDLATPDSISATIASLRAHRPFAVSEGSIFETALAAPYVPKSASPEKIAEWAAQEQQQEAMPKPKSRAVGRSWTGGDLRARAPQPVEGNTALAALSKTR